MPDSGKGMPVYLDSVERNIISWEDEPNNVGCLYHSNVVARKFWACVEIFRDVNDLLEEGEYVKISGKRKKKAKFIVGHVHTQKKEKRSQIYLK